LGSAQRNGVIASEATFQNYMYRLTEAGFVRRTGSKGRVMFELTPLARSAVEEMERWGERVVTLKEDSGHLCLDAKLATNIPFDKGTKKAARQTMLEITKQLDRLASLLTAKGNDVALTLTYTFMTRKSVKRLEEILEGSRRVVQEIDLADEKAAWMNEWHRGCVMRLAGTLKDSTDAETIFGLVKYRASLACMFSVWPKSPEGKEVYEEVLAALLEAQADYRSRKDDVYHLSSRILSLDLVTPTLNALEDAVHYASEMSKSVPARSLLETSAGPGGKKVYKCFEWLQQTNIAQLLQFEDWLKQKHPEAVRVDGIARPIMSINIGGKKVSMPSPLPVVTQDNWKRCARYYNSFLAEKLRAIAYKNALLAIRYLTLLDKFPHGNLKRAIEKYGESRKTALDSTWKLLSEQ